MWLVAAIALLGEPEPVELHGFADTYWYSANVSRGKIPFARPILFQELEVDAVSRDFGQLNFYYAATHSLSDVRDKVCKRFDIEDDDSDLQRERSRMFRSKSDNEFRRHFFLMRIYRLEME